VVQIVIFHSYLTHSNFNPPLPGYVKGAAPFSLPNQNFLSTFGLFHACYIHSTLQSPFTSPMIFGDEHKL